jgi:hypothetical protein
MLLKLGVSIERLCDPMRRALSVVEDIWKELGQNEPVVTSTYEGTHMPASLHYVNRAADFRKPIDANAAVARLKSKLGQDYDVVLEQTHIHIEYDPKDV